MTAKQRTAAKWALRILQTPHLSAWGWEFGLALARAVYGPGPAWMFAERLRRSR